MPRGSIIITCPICGRKKKVRNSHIDSEFTCGRKKCTSEYKWQKYLKKFEKKYGEPLEQLLHRLYTQERKSYRYICGITGMGNRTITKALKYFGIEIRYGSEAIKTQWENNDERRQEQAEFFREVGYQHAGPNHPNWQGGISKHNGTRCTLQEWRRLAEQIRKRDGYRCTRCEMTNAECIVEFGQSLEVHHIIPYILSKDDHPSNLRSLCPSCHRTVEYEFYWLL